MDVDEQAAPTPADLRGLAFLEEGSRPVGDAPAWLDQVLGGRLAVALYRPTRSARPAGSWLAAEEVEPGLHALACDGADVARLVAAMRSACAGGGLAVVALGPGSLGRSVLLGPVPDRATALFAERRAARRPGVFVDEAVLAALREPAVPVGTAFQLREATTAAARPAWRSTALALAAALVLGFGLFRLLAPVPPEGRIYLHGQHTSLERGASDETWRAGDQVVVALEGAVGTYATVLLLDSHDRLVVPEASAVNVALGQGAQKLEIKKVFDDQPGRERFLGVVSRAPLAELDALLTRLNAQPASRTERLAALAEALDDAVVVPAAELEHR